MKAQSPAILLIACYELGHQPLSLAWPLAFLRRAGLEASTLDLAVQPFDDTLASGAAFVALSTPMHTALRIGVEAARRVRKLNPTAHICFHGLYAWLNQDYLLQGIADSVVGGEAEDQLVALVQAHVAGQAYLRPAAMPVLDRLAFPLPARSSLQPVSQYAHYIPGGAETPAPQNALQQPSGYVESSRGCLHTCRHCPIVPIYGGRFFVVPRDVVLGDIRQQVAAGAQHVTFGDPDFLNAPKHALALARALHAEFPGITFDFTTKVEHILRHRALFPEFAALGATFVVTAIESLSNTVLEKLHKGHTAADIDAALDILDQAGIAIQPTLVAFTPWTTLDDYLLQIEWIQDRMLVEYIPAIHLSIRLLIPPRSAILPEARGETWLGPLDPSAFTYTWSHPDPRMDHLQQEIAELVEAASIYDEPAAAIFEKIRELAYAMAGKRPAPAGRLAFSRLAAPRLTENWFCCAEPTQSQISFQSFVADDDLRVL